MAYVVEFWRDSDGSDLRDSRTFDNMEAALRCRAELLRVAERHRKPGQVFAVSTIRQEDVS